MKAFVRVAAVLFFFCVYAGVISGFVWFTGWSIATYGAGMFFPLMFILLVVAWFTSPREEWPRWLNVLAGRESASRVYPDFPPEHRETSSTVDLPQTQYRRLSDG